MNAKQTTIRLKPKSDARSIRHGYPWVYNDDLVLDIGSGTGYSSAVMARMAEAHLTKYSAVDPDLPTPVPGYVLVIDQTEGDASVRACGGDRNRFLEMLFVAQEENPGAHILIKSHLTLLFFTS